MILGGKLNPLDHDRLVRILRTVHGGFPSPLVSVKEPPTVLISPAELRVERPTKDAGLDADVCRVEARAAEKRPFASVGYCYIAAAE